MKKSKKKKIYIYFLLAAMLILSAVIGVTIAYLMSRDDEKNDITVGQNKTDIIEDFAAPEKLIANTENIYKKEIYVENTGNISCYVRARLDFSSSEIMNQSTLSPDDTNYYSMENFRNNLNKDWTYNESDGYYYYTSILKAGDKTSALLKNVSTTYGDELKRYDIIVYTESVQIYGANGEKYTYDEAWENFK